MIPGIGSLAPFNYRRRAVRVLIIHNEEEYYAGAERMLNHFAAGLGTAGVDATVLAVAGSRTFNELADLTDPRPIPGNQKFSPAGLARQFVAVCREIPPHVPTVIHGWSARDWELTSLVGRLTGSGTLGTLHDHPAADFISRSRQTLMRRAATLGLDRIACVSHAVRHACVRHRYPADKLVTIHNGLPEQTPPGRRNNTRLKLGFLGAYSHRKGLDVLFQIIARYADTATTDWELHLAGEAQNDAGLRLVQDLRQKYSDQPWWSQIRFHQWIPEPRTFLEELDLLLFTSRDFDPLPTVILESGLSGTPVFAANVGGVPEMITEGNNGWLFNPNQPLAAAERLTAITRGRSLLRACADQAARHITHNFSLAKMIEEYVGIYSTLPGDDQ